MAEPKHPGVIRPFADFLREHRKGELHDELGERLNELVNAVQDTGKKGTVTLVLSVAPAARSDEMVIVSDEIRLKAPEPDRPDAVYFADHEGNLTRHNPRQPELPFREVSGPAREERHAQEVDRA